VEVRPSRLGGVRTLVDVVFSFANRTTDVVDKYFVRVDVTEEFPFLSPSWRPTTTDCSGIEHDVCPHRGNGCGATTTQTQAENKK
jgi:hypothetical protein